MTLTSSIRRPLAVGWLSLLAMLPACDSSDADEVAADAGPSTTDAASDSDAAPDPDAGGEPLEGCAATAATFQTLGSANADLPDPEVSATCEGDTIVVRSNQIPDFPYIETSPGNPEAFETEFNIPAVPVEAEVVTAIPALGALGVAINGVPIFGPTEGAGGDVMALGGGFTECGGHNGPTGYHFHTFDVTGSDDCRFTQAQASAGHVLFGYAFDGYPIYSGNFQFESSYELTDEAQFSTDTWAAHTYVEGSGDLDECNGRTDEDGNYAYYTTDAFPYVMGCYRGVVADNGGGGGMMGPPPGQP